MDDSVGEKLIATLRKLAPARVRVFDAQDVSRDVAVPSGRKRWSAVAATVEARPWVRLELLDKHSAILGYVENDAAPGELEDIGAREPSGMGQARWFLELMIKAQTAALTFRDKEHTALLQSVREILDVNSQATREMMQLMRAQRDEAMELAAIRAAAEQGDGMDQVVKLIEASPKLMQLVGPLLMALRPAPKLAPAPAPKNGAAKS